jgi:hypothetical protein
VATIKGTSGPDVFELTTNDLYEALEGDDKVTIKGRWGTVQPGQGNDTIIIDPSIKPKEATVWYWSSPNAILVDLAAGYALDGFGTRDTLVGVRNVHGFQKNGDKGYGTEGEDGFYVGSPWGGRTGTILIDGRGGYDSVGINVGSSQDNFGELKITASADGRSARMWFANHPKYIIELQNLEEVNTWNPEKQVGTAIILTNLISLERGGQDTLLRGAAGWQTQAPGSATTVTYSFLAERPAEGAEGGTGFVAFTAAQQKIVRDVFDRLQQQTGVTFREISGGTGDIRFGINQQTETRGYSFVPDFFRGQAKAGDVWIDVESAALMNPGQEGYYALLHELGHALGLQHPLGEADTSGATVLLNRFASLSNSVMLERSASETGGVWPTWFGALDMQALRFLYGSRSVATGSDRYMLSDLGSQGFFSVLDDGGDDTFDASTAPLGVSLDLRPGWLSSVGISAAGEPLRNNLSVGVGVNIENAIGSVHDDLIVGTDGPNRLQGHGGSDMLDGGGGVDWAIFKGGRSGWAVEAVSDGVSWFVSARDGVNGMAELRRVERVRFDDKAIALDMGKTDSGGQALLLIGAVLGKDLAMSKATLIGQVIDLFDQGLTMMQLAGALMRLPIWGGVLTPTNSSEDIARHLLRINKGAEPTAAEVAAGALTINTQAQGTLLSSLAQNDANVALIGLSSLASTGFEYPLGG